MSRMFFKNESSFDLKKSLLHSVMLRTYLGRQLNRRAPLKGREWKRKFVYLPDRFSGLMKIVLPFLEVVADWGVIRFADEAKMFGTLLSKTHHRYITW